jgi:hypothetical protein
VLAGGVLLVAMLWMIGAGLRRATSMTAARMVAGAGLNGYGALYRLLEKTGHPTDFARDENGFRQKGLLILTPPQYADGGDIERIVAMHRAYGPVLVITPKWLASDASTDQPGVEQGWVRIKDVDAPQWEGFLDDVGVTIAPATPPITDRQGATAILPYPAKVMSGGMSGSGKKLIPLVLDAGARILAARYDDPTGGALALIFEPDLANNAGLARWDNAEITLRMIDQMVGAGDPRVTFDLTLNGLGRQPLLTLAFTPPYLAATLALILAGWRCCGGPMRALARLWPRCATLPLASGRWRKIQAG